MEYTNNVGWLVMDYDKWQTERRNPALRGTNEYSNWFLQNAQELPISRNIYEKVIKGHPAVHHAISVHVIEAKRKPILVNDQSNIYIHALNLDILKMNSRISYVRAYNGPEFDSFCNFLERIEKEELFAMMRYSILNGWLTETDFS
jgi:hypothetical protein